MKKIFPFIILLILTSLFAQDKYVDSIKAALQRSTDENKVKSYLDLSNYYSYISTEKVIEYGKKALKLAQEINDKQGIADALYRLGEGQVNQKDYDKAFENYLESLKLFKEVGDTEGIFMANNGIGRAYDNVQKYQKAYEYYSDALKQAKINKDKKQQAVALMNLGNTVDHIGKPFEEEIDYYTESFKLSEELGDTRFMVFNLINLADTYTQNNKPDLAIKNLAKGIELAEKYNLSFALFNLYGNLGLAQKSEGKYEEALKNMKKCLNYLPPENLQSKLNVYSELPKLYFLNNQFKKAYNAQIIYDEVKDTLFSAQRDKRFSELQTKYETEKKEQQIKLLEKDNQIQTLWRNSFIGAFVFAFILAAGLYNRYRYKNRTSKELTNLNNQLEGDLQQAAEYIESLLPQKLNDKVQTDWRFIPSAHLGGDSFGYSFLDENHFSFYLIDVSGHGVGAALLSTSILNILKSKSLANTDFYNPAQVLNSLNKSFDMEEQDNKYFALWYGVIDLETKELICASAFHPPAIGVSGGEIMQYGKKEMMIGAFDEYYYDNTYYQLSPGDSIFLFSDGCFEVELEETNMEFEDFKQLLKSSKENGDNPLEYIYSYLIKIKKTDRFEDDFSIIKIDV